MRPDQPATVHLTRAAFGFSLLAALGACHPGAPAGPAPAACRHPAVVFQNLYSRRLAVLTPAVPYGPGGELLAELEPGDTSAAIPLARARGALLRDAVTGGSVAEEHVKVLERCLDAPAALPSVPRSAGSAGPRRGSRTARIVVGRPRLPPQPG